MQASFSKLVEKINTLTLRERVLVLIAVLIVVYQAWDSLVWLPLVDREDRLLAQESRDNDALIQTQVDLTILTAKANQDPDLEIKKQIKNLEAQLSALKQQINKTSASLVSPDEMVKLLEELLTSEKGLQLLQLQTQESVPLITSKDTSGKKELVATNFQIYRHGFTIEFTGSYLATLRYIEALEKLPWTFFWDGIDYQVDGYPNSRVKLNLYTLSLSEGWIGV